MRVTMEDSIKRWAATRKMALVVRLVQGKTMVAEVGRACDRSLSEIEAWVDYASWGMGTALRANPLDIRDPNEKQQKDHQDTDGEACWDWVPEKAPGPAGQATVRHWSEDNGGLQPPAGRSGRWDHGGADQAMRLVWCAAGDGVVQTDEGCAVG